MANRVFRAAVMAALLALVCLTACGCDLTFSPEELYSLPKLPAEYEKLDNSIQEILTAGAEYAAPTSGSNIQPVQMKDLNNDGQEEALVFFRNTADERPLKIYIFSNQDGGYEQSAVIEGSGTAIYSISYNDLDQDGWVELIVGWRVTTELQALTVYSLRGPEPEELLRTNYSRYAVADLNQDQFQELVVLRSDDEGNGMADYFGWRSGSLGHQSSVRISSTVAELSQQGRVRSGSLRDGVPALFVTGVEDSSVEITDILTVKNDELTNLTISDTTGVSTEIYTYLGLYPMDINGDMVTELPIPVGLPMWEDDTASPSYRIDWRSYDSAGAAEEVLSTYHDIEDGWYLRLPDAWRDKIVVVRRMMGPDEAAVTFSIRDGTGPDRDFLAIYTISGENREIKAVRDGRIVLSRQSEVIYAAKLLDANADWEYGLTEDDLSAAFKRIDVEWTTGEN